MIWWNVILAKSRKRHRLRDKNTNMAACWKKWKKKMINSNNYMTSDCFKVSFTRWTWSWYIVDWFASTNVPSSTSTFHQSSSISREARKCIFQNTFKIIITTTTVGAVGPLRGPTAPGVVVILRELILIFLLKLNIIIY